ncbi:hypothetical protein SEA_LUCKYBARNES_50 [Brevibacterium phage LuckyBarnes]|uniref:Uncharacterized protein n=1 Tax=Brevibacterium phage LuckyBarnes TaxID=2027888 RepID=A0A249XNP6_9CAUD|nr:hypothetical protein HOS02_gp50 [Brevibacterium phage LuckyBarnes]ASZ73367.1 hypothetical protein SEA_LUCKYBARNES_50 [Brevibacterium phage LuckyBarnes]
MNIVITIDGDLTDADRTILRALAGDAPAAAPFADTLPKAEPKPAKAKPGPKPKPKPEPVKEEKPEEAPQETKAEEPTVAPADESKTVETALSRAAELLGSGKVDLVKGILKELGVARVSGLSPEQAATFLERVEGE